MVKIECGATSCIHNKRFSQFYGYCECPNNPVLKFRLAANLDKGTIIMMECLNLELPEGKIVT